ncbi:MAG: 3-hydroxy-9,10-secoandrosta,3,5(10)-triene-9,17-dione monooxygenase [Acetobacteraceae bacterium]|nr:3-hydroxy-9,10-secoandrosta,3,5(10)-triene-9,17-dione monooxygenase [Acetobacteraceae bacterium]
MSAAPPAPPPPGTDALARARLLVPVLAAREQAATAARDVPTETIDDFRRAGILRLLQPRRFGGEQASVGVFLRIVDILAEGCASSAWVYGVLAELEWVIACLPEQGQIDIWGDDPEALSVGSIAPRASGRRAQGGWRVSGRYPFASGCRHARWAILGARCKDVAGNEVPRYLFVPMHDLEIVDDWHTLGMRGTGSFSVAAHDVFVPEHRTLTIQDAMAGTPPGRLVHPDYALLRAPRYFIVPFVLPAAAFGAARRALALAPAALRGSTRTSSDALHLRLGEAAAQIDAANLIFATRRAETVELMESGAPVPGSAVLRNRRDVALAFRLLRSGVEQLVTLCGAGTVYDDSPLQSVLRDITTIATHIVVNEEAGMVPYGRFMMVENMA